jgi:hypothetical protein
VVERKRLGVNVAFEADLGEGFTLIAEGFYAKLDEYNRAVGINISNRWDGGAFGVWNQPTCLGSGRHRQRALAGRRRVRHQRLVGELLHRQPHHQVKTKNYNLELNYDNGGPSRSRCAPSAPTAIASA